MTPPAQRRIEELVSRVLRIGVLTSSALILLGFVIYLTVIVGRPHAAAPNLQVGLLASDIVRLGLLVLILTPVMRVAVAAVAYAHVKDKGMTVVATTVLVFLALAFAVGLYIH